MLNLNKNYRHYSIITYKVDTELLDFITYKINSCGNIEIRLIKLDDETSAFLLGLNPGDISLQMYDYYGDTMQTVPALLEKDNEHILSGICLFHSKTNVENIEFFKDADIDKISDYFADNINNSIRWCEINIISKAKLILNMN